MTSSGESDTPSRAEIAEKIDHLKEIGVIEVHPDDLHKPWGEQRLRRTALGELLAEPISIMQEDRQS
jgi:hypothetical protein